MLALEQAAAIPLPQSMQLPLTPVARAAFTFSPFYQQPLILQEWQGSRYEDLYLSLLEAFASSGADLEVSGILECLQPVIVFVGLPDPAHNSAATFIMERICKCKLLEQKPLRDHTICVTMKCIPGNMPATFKVRVNALEEQVPSKEDIAECAGRMIADICQLPEFSHMMNLLAIEVEMSSPEIIPMKLVGLPCFLPAYSDAGIKMIKQFVRNQPAALVGVLPSMALNRVDQDGIQSLVNPALALAESASAKFLLAYTMDTCTGHNTVKELRPRFQPLDLGSSIRLDRHSWLSDISLLQHPLCHVNAADIPLAEERESTFFEGMLQNELLQPAAAADRAAARQELENHMGHGSLMIQVCLPPPQCGNLQCLGLQRQCRLFRQVIRLYESDQAFITHGESGFLSDPHAPLRTLSPILSSSTSPHFKHV